MVEELVELVLCKLDNKQVSERVEEAGATGTGHLQCIRLVSIRLDLLYFFKSNKSTTKLLTNMMLYIDGQVPELVEEAGATGTGHP